MKRLMLFAFVLSLASPAFARSIPPQPGASAVPEFIGRPAVPHPIRGTRPIPQNPFTASDPWNNGHDDSYMSDTYPLGVPGPFGQDPQVLSTFLSIPTSQAPFALSSALCTLSRFAPRDRTGAESGGSRATARFLDGGKPWQS